MIKAQSKAILLVQSLQQLESYIQAMNYDA